MRPKDMLTTNKDDWRTPVKFFDRLNSEFGFDLDAASDDDNALCKRHFTKETDGLLQDWGGVNRMVQSSVLSADRRMGQESVFGVQEAEYNSSHADFGIYDRE